ncbi:MAG TPA: hypothetical protein VIJ78_07370 [Pseudolabrys sp.]
MHWRSSVSLVICAALAALLSGCASDDSTARLLVAPNKYVLYNCPEISRELLLKQSREKELRELMNKDGASAGARMVSGFTYDPEYLSVRGEINDLRATAAEKNCTNLPAAGAVQIAKPTERIY